MGTGSLCWQVLVAEEGTTEQPISVWLWEKSVVLEQEMWVTPKRWRGYTPESGDSELDRTVLIDNCTSNALAKKVGVILGCAAGKYEVGVLK